VKKANPLFVDSTKMRGDSILTSIELRGLSNHFGASVFVRIRDEAVDAEKVFHLQPAEEGVFRAQVYLQHLTEINYQFFLSRDEVVLSSSPTYVAMAGHVITEDWAAQSIFDDNTENVAEQVNAEEVIAESSEAVSDEIVLEAASVEENILVNEEPTLPLAVEPIPQSAESVSEENLNVLPQASTAQATLSLVGAVTVRERLIGVALDRVLELNRKEASLPDVSEQAL